MNTTSYHIVACRSRGAMPKIGECSAHSLKWVEAGEKKKKRVVGQQQRVSSQCPARGGGGGPCESGNDGLSPASREAPGNRFPTRNGASRASRRPVPAPAGYGAFSTTQSHLAAPRDRLGGPQISARCWRKFKCAQNETTFGRNEPRFLLLAAWQNARNPLVLLELWAPETAALCIEGRPVLFGKRADRENNFKKSAALQKNSAHKSAAPEESTLATHPWTVGNPR